MTQPDRSPSSPSQAPSRRRGRQSRLLRRLAHFWGEWRVEIFTVLVVALGVFLLVERMQIRETLLRWVQQGFQFLKGLGGGIGRGLVDFLQNTTLSDLTGYVLLLLASVFVFWRVRWRLLTTPRIAGRDCPHCGGVLIRIHRRPIDRLMSLYVPVARYRCRNHECGWQGLRVRGRDMLDRQGRPGLRE
jgi:hypothetical protein